MSVFWIKFEMKFESAGRFLRVFPDRICLTLMSQTETDQVLWSWRWSEPWRGTPNCLTFLKHTHTHQCYYHTHTHTFSISTFQTFPDLLVHLTANMCSLIYKLVDMVYVCPMFPCGVLSQSGRSVHSPAQKAGWCSSVPNRKWTNWSYLYSLSSLNNNILNK